MIACLGFAGRVRSRDIPWSPLRPQPCASSCIPTTPSFATLINSSFLLRLMPAPQRAQPVHPSLGRPTKELDAIVGLLLIKEFLNLTGAQAVEAYDFRMDVHYAHTVPSSKAELSERTLQRYEQLFRGDALARMVMEDVTRE